MEFSVIAAMDQRRGIGRAGTIPWKLKSDLKHFHDVTVGPDPEHHRNVVIMGRTTWLSLPERRRPLPDRWNIVLSRQPLDLPPAVEPAHDFDEALTLAEAKQAGDIFVIGGGMVYSEAVQHGACTKAYLTELSQDFQCDTFFPELPDSFQLVESSDSQRENDIDYRFLLYQRRP